MQVRWETSTQVLKNSPPECSIITQYSSLEAVDKSCIHSAYADNKIYNLSISNLANKTIFQSCVKMMALDITEISFMLMHLDIYNVKIVRSMVFIK